MSSPSVNTPSLLSGPVATDPNASAITNGDALGQPVLPSSVYRGALNLAEYATQVDNAAMAGAAGAPVNTRPTQRVMVKLGPGDVVRHADVLMNKGHDAWGLKTPDTACALSLRALILHCTPRLALYTPRYC
jgi:hypothetical protein